MKTQEKETKIFEAAYTLLKENGYKGTSMLAIAKKAAASNETLYNWYGNKQGLLAKMISSNASPAAKLFASKLGSDLSPYELLEHIGPALIMLTTSERAILLNRAAAADVADGALLGKLLNQHGRNSLLPLLKNSFQRMIDDGVLTAEDAGEVAEVYISLLLGDRQIRRVTGVIRPSSKKTAIAHSARTLKLIYKIYDGN